MNARKIKPRYTIFKLRKIEDKEKNPERRQRRKPFLQRSKDKNFT